MRSVTDLTKLQRGVSVLSPCSRGAYNRSEERMEMHEETLSWTVSGCQSRARWEKSKWWTASTCVHRKQGWSPPFDLRAELLRAESVTSCYSGPHLKIIHFKWATLLAEASRLISSCAHKLYTRFSTLHPSVLLSLKYRLPIPKVCTHIHTLLLLLFYKIITLGRKHRWRYLNTAWALGVGGWIIFRTKLLEVYLYNYGSYEVV